MKKRVEVNPGGQKRNLLELLRENDIYIPAFCGGKGTCGKCRVRFCGSPASVSASDRAFLSSRELSEGWRLACQAEVSGPVVVELEDGAEENMQAAVSFQLHADDHEVWESGPEERRIAADIGTTTIAAASLSRQTGEAEKTAACVNHQRAYGADVISRMEASNRGHGGEMQKSVLRDLEALREELCPGEDRVKYYISGNTTMEHLLQGLSCRTLGVAPYVPVDLSLHDYRNMVIMPGISTFVGADIVSGIVACGMDQSEDTEMLIDLGTNGEMVIGNRDRMLCTSAAAGPAFEGGNITCGTAGVPGAISSVRIMKNRNIIRTLGSRPAVGICGTGVLEVMYELLEAGIVDPTGRMADAYLADGYPLTGNVRFTAKDVREVQLAKAAIRAGVEILIREYGAEYQDVSRIFLAGGFGQKINIRKAIGIGLLPEEFEGRIEAVGNSSLAGAVLLAQGTAEPERFSAVAGRTEEVSLASHDLFHSLYMKYMMFPLRIN